MTRLSGSIKITSMLGAAYLLIGIFIPTAVFITNHSRACALQYNCPAYALEYVVTTTSAWHFFRAASPVGILDFIILGIIDIIPFLTAIVVVIVNFQSLVKHITGRLWTTYRILMWGASAVFLIELVIAIVSYTNIFQSFYPLNLLNILIMLLINGMFLLNFIALRHKQSPLNSITAATNAG